MRLCMSKFDEAYYDRYYRDTATRAVSESEQTLQAEFIAAYLRYLNVEVSRIVDIGCGLGRLLSGLGNCFPEATCVGVETSTYLCDTYGWVHGSVVDYADDPYDLVVCADVLGYLSKRDARRAIRNLSDLTNSALYLSVLTLEDLDICDQEHTDMDQKIRSFDWYQKHLSHYFVAVGGGLYLKQPLAYPVWRLERL